MRQLRIDRKNLIPSFFCSLNSENGETIMLPAGLEVDQVLDAGEEIFGDCKSVNPERQRSAPLEGLVGVLVRLVSSLPEMEIGGGEELTSCGSGDISAKVFIYTL